MQIGVPLEVLQASDSDAGRRRLGERGATTAYQSNAAPAQHLVNIAFEMHLAQFLDATGSLRPVGLLACTCQLDSGQNASLPPRRRASSHFLPSGMSD
jgi:hypothetical protein